MKKIRLLVILMVAIMATTQFIACGDDSSSSVGGNSSTPTQSSSSESAQDSTTESSTESSNQNSTNSSTTPVVEEYTLTLYVDGSIYSESELPAGASLELPTPEKVNYTFSGWYQDAEMTAINTASVMPESNLELYGAFSEVVAERVNVTYVYGKNSTSESIEKGSALSNAKANEIAKTLQDAHYVFVNWNTQNGEAYDFSAEVNEDITLVADYYSDGFEVVDGYIEWYTGKSTEVIVPAQIGDTKIVGLYEFLFDRNKKITSVYVSEGITHVEDSVFSNCTALTDVYLPTTLEYFGLDVFSGSPALANGGIHFAGNQTFPVENGIVYADAQKTKVMLYVGEKGANVQLANGVTHILPRAFENMNVGAITIPESVEQIGGNAFNGSYVKEVNYLTSLSIPESCFKNCSSLENITIANDVQTIGANAFEGCANLKEIQLPEALEEIGTGAFMGCLNLKQVELPENYRNFTGSEFSGAGIEYFEIPSYLTEIGENMFAGWTYLKAIEIPEGITAINNGAFIGCTSLTEIVIPSTVKRIGREFIVDIDKSSFEYMQNGCMVFGNCTSLEKVDLSKATSLEYIGPRSFFGCSKIEYLEIPENLLTLDEGALAGLSNLKHLKLSFIGRESQKSYQREILRAALQGAIYYGYIDHVYTKNETYEELLQMVKSLTDDQRAVIAASDKLTDYGKKLFNNAAYYFGTQEEYDKFIATPEGCANANAVFGYIFGKYTYAGATEVKQYYGASADGGTSGVTYYIPNSLKTLEIYKTTTLAAYALSNIQNVPELVTTSVKRLGARAYYLTGVTELVLPESVEEVGEACFSWAMKLKTLIIPDRVAVIGNEAFSYCIEVETVKLPASDNLYVGAYAFRGCKKLNHVYQTEAYANKDSGVYLEKGLLGNAMLMETEVKSVYIGKDVVFALLEGNYGQQGGVFTSCTSLTNVEIHNDFRCMLSVDVEGLGRAGDVVSFIPGSFFSHCSSLATVNGKTTFEIPAGITHINGWAFSYCSLTSVVFPESVSYVGTHAFYESSITGTLDIRYVDYVGTCAFMDCRKLTKIIWNKDLVLDTETTGAGFFEGCTSLSTFALYDETTNTVTEKEGYAYVPSIEKTPRYFFKQTAVNYVIFSDPEKLTTIDMQFAYKNTSLQEISIPANVTSIGGTAFHGCTALKKVTFEGNNLLSISSNAFENCSALTEIVIPEGVIDMSGASMFRGCTNLVRITLPSTLRELPTNSAFRDCTSLREIVLLSSYAPDVDGGLMDKASMLQMGEVSGAGMIDELIQNGLKIYVPADSVELYKSYYSTYGGYLRDRTGWFVYANAITPLYAGVYTDGTTTVNVEQTTANLATVTVNGGEKLSATVEYTENGATFTFDGGSLEVNGRIGTYNSNNLYRISGMYMDQSAKYELNDLKQYHSKTNALGELVKHEAADWMQARKMQFKQQLHIYPDGRVEIWEFKDSQAYVSESYGVNEEGKTVNIYLTLYPPTVYKGTWTLNGENIQMVFNGVTVYKNTVSGSVNAEFTAIVEFSLTRAISTLNNGISVAMNETQSNLSSSYTYTRVG